MGFILLIFECGHFRLSRDQHKLPVECGYWINGYARCDACGEQKLLVDARDNTSYNPRQ